MDEKQGIWDLIKLSDTFTSVIKEVTRLEEVNKDFYEKNRGLHVAWEGQRVTIEDLGKTVLTLKGASIRMKNLMETLMEDVETSDNLITLKVHVELYKDKIKDISG